MQPKVGHADLVAQLRAAGDPLDLMAAEALANLGIIAERLQPRVYQLEALCGESQCSCGPPREWPPSSIQLLFAS